MPSYGWILIGIFAGIVILCIVLYNDLVRKKTYVTESFSTIDVQLKRKANVLQNLMDVLKLQTDYESDLLIKITQARRGLIEGSDQQRMEQNDALSRMMPSIYAVSENYPELGANQSFRDLMASIEDCENKIAYARTRYNITVTQFNTALLVFPQSMIAKLGNFEAAPVFEITEAQRTDADNLRIKDLS